MFEWWKKQKEKDSKRKDLVELLEDSILNGAKTIDAVVVGKLPFPIQRRLYVPPRLGSGARLQRSCEVVPLGRRTGS